MILHDAIKTIQNRFLRFLAKKEQRTKSFLWKKRIKKKRI